MLFRCPLYAPLRLRNAFLFADALGLQSFCQSVEAEVVFYDCLAMHCKWSDDIDLSYPIEKSLAPTWMAVDHRHRNVDENLTLLN